MGRTILELRQVGMLSYLIGGPRTGVVTNWEARVAAVLGVVVEPAVVNGMYHLLYKYQFSMALSELFLH